MGRICPPAVFLDRDGVLIEDAGLLTDPAQIRILPGVPEARRLLKVHGYLLPVVSNQTVVARGLATEAETLALHREVERHLAEAGAPPLDGFHFCPHHPKATLAAFRQSCTCRKPNPGLLIQAAVELDIDLGNSFMVGDRPTDLIAGQRAGCRSIWVQTGQHGAPLIETDAPLPPAEPAHTCTSLLEAAHWILGQPNRA